MFKLSIKTYMMIFLLFLIVLGFYEQNNFINLTIQIIASVFTAVLLDLVINYLKNKKFIFPSSAVISGLIVGMVLSSGQNIFYYVIASALAILSKHILKFENKHIFNPANLGLLLLNIFFGASIGWWPVNIWFIIIPGLFIVFKIRRLHLVISYLLAFVILLMAYAYLKQGSIFDYFPLINLYFVFVMLIEPKTSAFKLTAGIVFGCFVAVAGFISYLFLPKLDYLLVGLALGNLFNSLNERFKK
ncbi:MAG: RnfABCDGE type electron transport complex subunit D [Candidatus Omnitrophota bacterium]|nr:RnfABCDGE type electron transport complex subunit D [Candidatus Omnitrophota bacterium]